VAVEEVEQVLLVQEAQAVVGLEVLLLVIVVMLVQQILAEAQVEEEMRLVVLAVLG
jgi:hypothetical protein|tara:strand:- start:96 stop:263 length:168 start_codon:yes stop_codon:yes gene_type:complete